MRSMEILSVLMIGVSAVGVRQSLAAITLEPHPPATTDSAFVREQLTKRENLLKTLDEQKINYYLAPFDSDANRDVAKEREQRQQERQQRPPRDAQDQRIPRDSRPAREGQNPRKPPARPHY